jgi:hypothetical protein
MFCGKCGKQLPEGSAFCNNCGAPVSKPPVKAVPVKTTPATAPVEAKTSVEQTIPVEAAPSAKAKKSRGGKALIGIGIVAVVIILIAALSNGGGSKSKSTGYVAGNSKSDTSSLYGIDYDSDDEPLPSDTDDGGSDAPLLSSSDLPLLYVTGGELVYNTNIEENTTITVDENFITSEASYPGMTALHAQWQAMFTVFTEDYKKVVYARNYEDDIDDTYTLCWAPVTKSEKGSDSATKIASDVEKFELASKADALVYRKDSKLYYYDFENDPLFISDDVVTGGVICHEHINMDYRNNNYGVHTCAYFAISDDGKYVFYGKANGDEGDDLYVYNAKSGESVKIASDVYTIYYYDTEGGFESVLYSKLTDRAESLYRSGRSGAEQTLISDTYYIISVDPNGYCFYYSVGADGSHALNRYDIGTAEKLELAPAAAYYYEDARNGTIFYSKTGEDGNRHYLLSIAGGEGIEVEEDGSVATAYISEDGKTLYAVVMDENEAYKLVGYTIGNGSVSDRTEIAGDVSPSYLDSLNGCIYYMTDYSNGVGSLYILDGTESIKLADEGGYMSAAGDGFVFFTDIVNAEKGTLYLYDGKSATKIASDIYCDIDVLCYYEYDGGLLYLADLDIEDGGTLYLWDGKDNIKIADDVQAIIPLEPFDFDSFGVF